SLAACEVTRDRHRLVAEYCFDRLTRRNNTEQRYLVLLTRRFLPDDFDPSTYVGNPPNEPFALEPRKNVVNARRRTQFELLTDLGHRRRKPVRISVSTKIIVNLSLPRCYHFPSTPKR